MAGGRLPVAGQVAGGAKKQKKTKQHEQDGRLRALLQHRRYCDLGMGSVVTGCARTRTLSRFGHGCFGNWMRVGKETCIFLGMHAHAPEHTQSDGVGKDALVIVYTRNTNAILVWAWTLWYPDALEH